MASHEKHDVSPVDDGLPLHQESGQWTASYYMKLKSEKRRRSQPRRFFLAFLVCSIVMLGLASIHSPTFRQKFSCHGGLVGNLKAGAEFGEESKSTTLTTAVDNEVIEDQQANRPEGEGAYYGGAPQATTKLQLARRETNSSVPAVTPSQTAQTADPDPTSSPTASSPKPSSEPPTSTPSPTPSPSPSPTTTASPSSTFKTSTTTPTPTTKSPTTKEPEPTSTPTAPPSNTGVQSVPSETQSSVKPTFMKSSSSTSSRGQASPTTTSSVDKEDDDPIPHDTTIFTTKTPNPTTRPPPTPPKVVITTSTRTSNGEVVIVESTITVQPSQPTKPVTQSEAPRPPAQLQNGATRPEAYYGMMLASMMACAGMGILFY